MKVLISTSAEFTQTQIKKLVKGANLTLLRVSSKRGVLIKTGSPVPANMREVIKSVLTITDVETNTKGGIKSITLSGRGLMKANELQKLLDAPVPKKTDRMGTESMRFSTAADLASANLPKKLTPAQKAANKPLETELADLDSQIQQLTARRNAIKDKLDAKAKAERKATQKIKEAALADKGIEFLIQISKSGSAEKKILKPTLSAARKAPMSLSSQGTIYAINGSKKDRVMVYGSTDPISGRSIKGKAWFFVSNAAKNKYA